jgi:hypothetical protein
MGRSAPSDPLSYRGSTDPSAQPPPARVRPRAPACATRARLGVGEWRPDGFRRRSEPVFGPRPERAESKPVTDPPSKGVMEGVGTGCREHDHDHVPRETSGPDAETKTETKTIRPP